MKNFPMLCCVLIVTVAATGCGSNDDKPTTKLNSKKVEQFLSEDATAQLKAAVTVNCPSSIAAKDGKKFTCSAQSQDGKPIPLKATQTDAKGNVTWQMDARSTTAIAEDIVVEVKRQKKLVVTVDCPDVIKLEQGATFDCLAIPDSGDTVVVKVTQTDSKGSVRWAI